MHHRKYAFSILFVLMVVYTNAQMLDGYKIPSNDVVNATDSIVKEFRNRRVDTFLVYREFCGECYRSLYLKGQEKPYFYYNQEFNTATFIFWIKNHRAYCKKIDEFAIYDSIKIQSTAIFTYGIKNWNTIKTDKFITNVDSEYTDPKGNKQLLVTSSCLSADGYSNSANLYLHDSSLYIYMDNCNLDFSVKDTFFIRNFTSGTHILELMVQNDVSYMRNADWKSNQKMYFTKEEFMKWEKGYIASKAHPKN